MDTESVTAGQEPANTNPEMEEKKPAGPEESESPYKAELDRLKRKFEKEIAHKEHTIQAKDEVNQKLLDEVRELRNAFEAKEPNTDDEMVEVEGTKFKKAEIDSLNKALKHIGISSSEWTGVRDTLNEIKTHLVASKEESEINRLSLSAEERELIQYHLTNTVKRSGNVADDVANARAIANKHLTEKKDMEETEQASMMACVGSGISGTRISITPGMSSGKREALKILKGMDPTKKWEKHLK